MIDISLIPVFGTSQVDSSYSSYSLLLDSVYKLTSSSCASYYHICDTPQSLPDIRSGVFRTIQKSFIQSPKDAHDRHFKSKFIDRRSAFLQDFSSYEPKRSLNFTVALLLQRQRSCRRSQENANVSIVSILHDLIRSSGDRCYAAQNCETLTHRGLRAFLLACAASRHTFKKSLQIELKPDESEPRSTHSRSRSTQRIGDRGRGFLRRIVPRPDIPIVVVQSDEVTIAKNHNLEELPIWAGNADSGSLSGRSYADSTRIGKETPLPEREVRKKPIGFTNQDTTSKIDWSEPCSRATDCSLQDGRRWVSPTISADCSPLRCNLMPPETLTTKPSTGDGSLKETDTSSESNSVKNGSIALGTFYQRLSFWKLIEPFPDIPIVVQSAAFLLEGGAS